MTNARTIQLLALEADLVMPTLAFLTAIHYRSESFSAD